MMELGQMIKRLEMIDREKWIMYDFGNLVPKTIASSRGSYDELALSHEDEPYTVKVGELLEVLRGAVDKTFQGYKGGDFLMSESTEVCVDNDGIWSNTQIVGIRDGLSVVIVTQHDLE